MTPSESAGADEAIALLEQRLAMLRPRLYQRDADEEDRTRYLQGQAELIALRNRQPPRSSGTPDPSTISLPPETSPAATSRPDAPRRSGLVRRRRRIVVLAAAAALTSTAIAAVVVNAPHPPPPAPQRPVAVAQTLALRGTAAQIRQLRVAIGGATEGANALVTSTAIREVPALRSATRLSESDVTGTGRARITLPDVDQFTPQRTATVLTFCARSSSFRWTMRGTTGTGAGARPYLQRGVGHDCGRLSYSTVPLPPSLHELTLDVTTARTTRLLLMLQSAG